MSFYEDRRKLVRVRFFNKMQLRLDSKISKILKTEFTFSVLNKSIQDILNHGASKEQKFLIVPSISKTACNVLPVQQADIRRQKLARLMTHHRDKGLSLEAIT